MGEQLLVLVLYVLAVARFTRVITDDKIGEPLRKELIWRLGERAMITYLFHCRWCMSIWIAFALAPAAVPLAGLSWWLLPFLALSASMLTGLLVRLEGES